MEHDRQPIGYWLKRLDRLIDEAFERTLGADGLTRRHWQVLNTLARGPATIASLAAALQPFVGDDANGVVRVVDDLLRQNWIRRVSDGALEVSDQGRSAHTDLTRRVAETRQRLRDGITDEETSRSSESSNVWRRTWSRVAQVSHRPRVAGSGEPAHNAASAAKGCFE